MTRIHTSAPVLDVSRDIVRLGDNPHATPAGQDFSRLLYAQTRSIPPPACQPEMLAQHETAVQVPRPQDLKATLEHLAAFRTTPFNAVTRFDRSTLVPPAAAAPLPAGGLDDNPSLNNAALMALVCSNAYSAALRAERMRGMAGRRAGACWNSLVDDIPAGCAPAVLATAQAQPASIYVWILADAVRFPVQWTRARFRRQRDLASRKSYRRDALNGEADDAQ